ncbi:MAG: response regulator [Clostridia bacterium]|nr:response regulator [Clostridia bacterium]
MKTLAVDDNLSQAENIAAMMETIDAGGIHEAECDQKLALNKLADASYDIAWLDVEMPGMTGLEMAAEIKKISPKTNIVFITDYPKYALDAMGIRASGFVVKPATEEQLIEEIHNLRHPISDEDTSLLKIQCFGNFEVFSRGERMRFSRSLGKEALAYLVDRRGAGCTVNEICAVLWEDRQTDVSLKSQCRVILAALRKDLEAVGADDVLVKMWNTWSIDPEKVTCDYYDFLRSDTSAINLFRGEYMSQYSWAEMRIGVLHDLAKAYVDAE